MKRIITALFAAVILVTPGAAAAQSPTPSPDLSALLFPKTNNSFESPLLINSAEAQPAADPQPVQHVVAPGDNLSKIAEAYSTDWVRVWAKNTELQDPDVLRVGDKLTIPLPDEVLDRELPAPVSPPEAVPEVVVPPAPSRTVTAAPAAVKKATRAIYDSGNTYSPGYCTWYVKNRRGASLPNSLGNANTWYSRAAALGMSVGSAPRAGAVGTTTRGSLGHVVYVESVNSNGTVNISEMNYRGLGVVSHRTTSASEFLYIY